ncbi:MAG: nucleotidyltransferase [Anaeromicrobium sp.]|jgi:predicted nucleotidyltransferase|uniref:nucleotidyltransferase n=1 Tax=Anaeromicrobium sp. TaxID=1929132 RepID=UPI0025D74273|nr:nucleotidyltransferase [Anaeromicrobium sp.]MCT4594883.1 nucleotidyltransferase [Anaeromicrobium sp.]
MNVVGIVAEYNPFHNGHKYHLIESLKNTKATHSIVVMSGNFLQRGEPAILDKWTRAQMAIDEGVDLVIELPFAYACNSAEYFAFGAVSLLNNMNIVDYVSFGSELGNIDDLTKISKVLNEEPSEYTDDLKKFLKEGISYPAAREKALFKYFNHGNLSHIIGSPNNILGIEYIKSLLKLGSPIKPSTVKRYKAHYHSKELYGNISSATAIRKVLFHNPLDKTLESVMPSESYKILQESLIKYNKPVFYNDFSQMIIQTLRKSSPEYLKSLVDVGEGLENRLKSSATKAIHIDSLLDNIKTKRYALTRIQRILIHSLMGYTKDTLNHFRDTGPLYARVLGFSPKGTELLKVMKERSLVPILTNINRQSVDSKALSMLSLDILATDLYTLSITNENLRHGGYDYYNKPYIKR